MELQSRDAPLPPFFAAVRRRHPDVDIVLLPPAETVEQGAEGQADEGQADEGQGPATERQLANAFDRTTGTATRVWAQAVGDGQLPETRFVFGPDESTVAARARLTARLDQSPLVALAAALVEGGWEAGERAGEVSQLFARRDSVQVVASYVAATGTFVLTVTSAPLPVGVDRARELARL